MRPELINRLDSIQVFHALTKKDVEKIFDNLLEDLKRRLSKQGIALKITPEVKKYLIDKGYDPKNGARPLRRTIEDKLESLISEEIIKGTLTPGSIASASLANRKLKLKVVNE